MLDQLQSSTVLHTADRRLWLGELLSQMSEIAQPKEGGPVRVRPVYGSAHAQLPVVTGDCRI